MIDVKALLEEMKASPYTMVEVATPHTGVLSLSLEPGAKVRGPLGPRKEKKGAVLATLERERNVKPIHSPTNGVVESVAADLNGTFVQAGTPFCAIRHYLTKAEVLAVILKKALFLFPAPERAKYYFVPEVDKKVRASGSRAVKVRDGMELFIVSRMKRESPLAYRGPAGIIYAVYFGLADNVDAGEPLIGVCPESQLAEIQDVVNRVQAEWEEPEAHG
ncbi:MAG: biotin attachment protein [Thermodesulfobacteriota bacterium]